MASEKSQPGGGDRESPENEKRTSAHSDTVSAPDVPGAPSAPTAGDPRPGIVGAKSGLVFISFKTEEVDHARKVKALLEKAGHRAYWQEDLQCGQQWRPALDEAVQQAGCIVVLWSRRALDSPWVRHEASQAIARGVYAPAFIEPLSLPDPFQDRQAADLADWDGTLQHAGFAKLLARIEEILPTTEQRIRKFLRRNWPGLLAAIVAATSLVGLWRLSDGVSRQLAQQDEVTTRQQKLADEVTEQARTLEALGRDLTRARYPLEDIRLVVWQEVTAHDGKADTDYLQTWSEAAVSAAAERDNDGSFLVSATAGDVLGAEEKRDYVAVSWLGFVLSGRYIPERRIKALQQGLRRGQFDVGFCAGKPGERGIGCAPDAADLTGNSVARPGADFGTTLTLVHRTTHRVLLLHVIPLPLKSLTRRTDLISSRLDLQEAALWLRPSCTFGSLPPSPGPRVTYEVCGSLPVVRIGIAAGGAWSWRDSSIIQAGSDAEGGYVVSTPKAATR